jgi:IS1 family transposase
VSIAEDSGLILTARVGKHTDELIEEIVESSEGKTDCQSWNTDGWGGYERVLPENIEHHIGKDKTQKIERINGILRQQTGRFHRRQNKFSKRWDWTKIVVRLLVTFVNWIWINSRKKTTAAQRANLTDRTWSWQDVCSYSTLL